MHGLQRIVKMNSVSQEAHNKGAKTATLIERHARGKHIGDAVAEINAQINDLVEERDRLNIEWAAIRQVNQEELEARQSAKERDDAQAPLTRKQTAPINHYGPIL